MALYTTPDGRVIIGTGVTDGNDYHGYNGKRDIVIQLTADGATTDGLNALEYLKAYAINAKAENKPIFPDGTRVFISANGYTKAVEADDVVIDGENVTIGGIAWNGSAWDYSGAGQVTSSLPEVDSEDNGKVLTVVDGAWAAASGGGTGGGVLVVTDTDGTLDKTWQEIHDGGFGIVVADYGSKISYLPIQTVDSAPFRNSYNVYVLGYGDDGAYLGQYKASSASGYPTYTAE